MQRHDLTIWKFSNECSLPSILTRSGDVEPCKHAVFMPKNWNLFEIKSLIMHKWSNQKDFRPILLLLYHIIYMKLLTLWTWRQAPWHFPISNIWLFSKSWISIWLPSRRNRSKPIILKTSFSLQIDVKWNR